MELIRGWESRFVPDITGGLRLSRASVYRTIGDEEGLGDRREGEVRVSMPGAVETTTSGSFSAPIDLVLALEDQPETVVKDLMPGERREFRTSIRVEDSRLGSPYLFCLSRRPSTRRGWKKLRAALPERYDTWTLTDDLDALRFEIECGLKRWLALTGITEHRLYWRQGWVAYSYDEFPPGAEVDELAEAIQFQRWFRKGRKYREQREYRLAWDISSPQMEDFPEIIDIELTRTGLGLFKPWKPLT